MDIKDIFEHHTNGKTPEEMHKSIALISEFMEGKLSMEDQETLKKKLYYMLEGGHYDHDFAVAQIEKMYYKDDEDDDIADKISAPYWTESEVKKIFDSHRNKIPLEYNFYDFMVALNMAKSDNWMKLQEWFPDESNEDLDKRVVTEAINWLRDDDNPFGYEKVWGYFNAKL